MHVREAFRPEHRCEAVDRILEVLRTGDAVPPEVTEVCCPIVRRSLLRAVDAQLQQRRELGLEGADLALDRAARCGRDAPAVQQKHGDRHECRRRHRPDVGRATATVAMSVTDAGRLS